MLDLRGIKLSDSAKKIAVSLAIIVFAFLVFVRLIYIPHKRALDVLKGDVQAAEREIAAIKAQAGTGESLEAAIEALRKNLALLENKFPSKEEVVLRELSALAKSAGMEIVSMNPKKKQMVKEVGHKAIRIEGYQVEELNIAVDASAGYRGVGEYIRMLKEACPVFIRINSLTMSKEGQSALRVNLVLTAYLLSRTA